MNTTETKVEKLVLANVLKEQGYIAYVIDKYDEENQKLTKDEFNKLVSIIKAQHPDKDESGDIGYSVTSDIIERIRKGVNKSHITVELILDGLKNDVEKDVVSNSILTRIPEKFLKNKKVVQAILMANPYCLTEVGYSLDEEGKELVKSHITKEIAIKYFTDSYSNLSNIPMSIQDEEVVRIALISGAKIAHVAPKFINLEMVVLGAIGISGELVGRGCKSLANKYVNRWYNATMNVTKGDLKSVILGEFTKMYMKNGQPQTIEVQEAVELLRFNLKTLNLDKMSEGTKRYLTEQDALNITNLTESFRHRRYGDYKGAELLQHLPVRLFTKDIIENIQENACKYVVDIKMILKSPVLVMNQEIANRQVEVFNPSSFKVVPSRFKTVELCKKAIELDGGLIEYVPKELMTELYVDAVKNGGLKSIPEENRTERLCSLAVEADALQFEFVPEDLKSYSMCIKAVEKDANNLKIVPSDKIDLDMKVRAVISYLENNDKFEGNGGWKPNESGHEGAEMAVYGMNRNQINEFFCDMVFKRPDLFKKIVWSSKLESSALSGVLRLEICIEAFKKDSDNIEFIPNRFHKEAWDEFVKNK